MARYNGGALSAGAGSTSLPLMALHGVSGVGGRVREIGVTNTTNVAVAVRLVRLTTAGTPGSSITVDKDDPNSAAAQCVLANTYTSTGPTLADMGNRTVLGASIGSAWAWTFGDSGLVIPAGTANGIGVAIENGTGQILQIYFVWDE